MDLKTYFFGMDAAAREDFAARCKSTKGHIQNVAYGYRTASADLAVAIEQQSAGSVTRQEMFPDTFPATWPELAKPSKKRPTTTLAA